MRTFLFTAITSIALLSSSFLNKASVEEPTNIEVSQPIVLKSGTIFDGKNKTYTLSSGANCPVFIIGNLESEPTKVVSQVVVKNLKINGNRGNQTEEIWQNGSNIRNNGITVRKGANVIISNVTVTNCRSGGIVLEKGCSRVSIINSKADNNEFDGIAAYESKDCLISNVSAKDNEHAGLSFDLGFHENLIVNCKLESNKHQGVFMRSGSRNNFLGLEIRNSRQAIFLASSELPDSQCLNNSFQGIFENNQTNFRVNDLDCIGNTFDFPK